MAVESGFEINDRNVIGLDCAIFDICIFSVALCNTVYLTLNFLLAGVGGGDLDFDALVLRQFKARRQNHGHYKTKGTVFCVIKRFRIFEVEHLELFILFHRFATSSADQARFKFLFNVIGESLLDNGGRRLAWAKPGDFCL